MGKGLGKSPRLVTGQTGMYYARAIPMNASALGTLPGAPFK